jgi:hypothetical protein
MKKIIVVGFVMIAVVNQVFANAAERSSKNTNYVHSVEYGTSVSVSQYTNASINNHYTDHYTVVVTNYTKEYKRIGYKPSGACSKSGCLAYHCEYILSDTDYYEIETVNKKTMLKYDVEGTTGEVTIKDEVVSKRKREVNQITSMRTNDWINCEDVRWIMSNITNYIANIHYISNSTNSVWSK